LLRDGLSTATTIVTYVILILGYSTIYQVVVKMRLWQVAVESMLISNLAALDHVQAGETTSSAVGEGLADPLGAGGILMVEHDDGRDRHFLRRPHQRPTRSHGGHRRRRCAGESVGWRRAGAVALC